MDKFLLQSVCRFYLDGMTLSQLLKETLRCWIFINNFVLQLQFSFCVHHSFTFKPGQAFCPRIKIWFCCSKLESVLCSNFSNWNWKTDLSSQASIWITKFDWSIEQQWSWVERWRMSRNVFGRVHEPGKPLSISIPVREYIISLFNDGFFESGIAKELRWRVLLMVRF